ncbi:MAG: SCP2 sterol-binding domain-containing protein [Pseudomonadota bacterium]
MESLSTSDISTHDLVRKLIGGMPGRLNKDAAKGLDATIEFDLVGEGGGVFQIVIQNQTCHIEEGKSPDPSASVKMSADTYIDLALGRVTGSQAFYKRKVRLTGGLNLIIKMHTLFPSLSKDEQQL